MTWDHPDHDALGESLNAWEGMELKCPRCEETTPDKFWHGTFFEIDATDVRDSPMQLDIPRPQGGKLAIDWIRCANDECCEIIIRIREWYDAYGGHQIPHRIGIATYLARPQGVQRTVSELVPEDMARDYKEASSIIELSPRMSAVLARRIMGDLLRIYGKTRSTYLTPQIDEFNKNTDYPRRLRENMHHFRAVSDFAAHTQTDTSSGEIIDVGREEAEWTLDLVDRLFDAFIVEPQADQKMRDEMDEKGARAGRHEIPPLPPDPGVTS